MFNVVGNGIACMALNTDSFLNINEVFVIENPFKSTIVINNSTKEDLFELYTIKGEKITEGKDISSQDFSYLDSGMYLVKLVTNNKVFKIIKK